MTRPEKKRDNDKDEYKDKDNDKDKNIKRTHSKSDHRLVTFETYDQREYDI